MQTMPYIEAQAFNAITITLSIFQPIIIYHAPFILQITHGF